MTHNPRVIPIIVDAVSDFYAVPKDILLGRCRRQSIVGARMVACYLSRRAGLQWERIAEYFERDHGTIISNTRRVEGLMETDDVFAAEVQRIVFEIGDRVVWRRLSEKPSGKQSVA